MELDEFVVMPNHFHGIIVIVRQAQGRGEAFADAPMMPSTSAKANASPLRMPRGTKPRSLNSIVQNFKSVSTRRINQFTKNQGRKIWQRNYYEHVIRDEDDLNRIRQHIVNDPTNSDMDENNPLIRHLV